MNVGTFAFILMMEERRPAGHRHRGSEHVCQTRADPLKALAMLVLLFSLAGVPPMLGFFAKL